MNGTTIDGVEVVVFRRTAGRQAFDAAGSAVGATLFLGMALVMGGGLLGADLPIRLFGFLGFGFFGLLMAAGAITSLRRGSDTRVAEIGPQGAWLPEMGFLAWPEIAEVRLEAMRGVGSGRAPVTARYERLGFVPRDTRLRPAVTTGLAWGMIRAYFALVRQIAPQLRVGGDDPAPFGVGALDIGDDFERLVETTRLFAPVLDQDEIRARRHAARWQASEVGVPAAPLHLAALDASLAPAAAVALEPVRPPVEVDLPAPQPRAAFNPRAVGALEIVFGILPVAAPLLVVGPFVLPVALGGGSGAVFGLFFLAFIVAVFVVPGALQLNRLASRIRANRSSETSLRIGPEGIWMQGSGLVPWSDVDQVRTERAGWVRQIGGPSYERWRLAVSTTAGGSAGVRSDEIDAPFDDVLDLVRFYHPVSESN